MQQRIVAAGYTPYTWIAENIAAGQSTPKAVLQSWLQSSGHRANILSSRAQDLGLGYSYNRSSTYKHYWVQHFGTR